MKISVLFFLDALLQCVNATVAPQLLSYRDPNEESFAFIDNFVNEWKRDHPSLSQKELSHVHATANKLKTNLANPPPPPPHITVPVSKPTNVPLPTKGYYPKTFNGKHSNQTKTDHGSRLQLALDIVRKAQREADIRNQERIANPRVNNYYDRHGKNAHRARALDRASLHINETVTAAAAIVADATAANTTVINHAKYELPSHIADVIAPTGEGAPLSRRAPPGSGSSWWMEQIPHEGKVPFGGNANYKVFRNVKDYGAKGDGKADDTDAINKAMTDGERCGANCGSSTVKPAIVYFPAGTYRIRQTIPMLYNTQVIGNANDLPVIMADVNFVGLGVLSSDEYTGGNGGAEEWYINQNNFLRQVRNLIIDTSNANMKSIAGLHWQVAQATSIFNVRFYGSKDRNKEHIGIFAENGSGGFMGDLIFTDSTIGIRCGNQQFTSHSLAFNGVGKAVDLLWDWGWTWKNMYIFNTDIGFNMEGDYMGGSMMVLDSHFNTVKLGISIKTKKGASDEEQFSVNLENIIKSNVGTMLKHESANVILPGGTGHIDSTILGKIYDEKHPSGYFAKGTDSSYAPRQPELVTSNGVATEGYYIRSKPQYEQKGADFFFNAHYSAEGDGNTDDTFGLQLAAAIAWNNGQALYIPMGSYIITNPINFPPGSVVVGECWAQLVAKGATFQDVNDPVPMITVGQIGDEGSMEIQDVLLTVQGPTAGAILMEWNVKADKQGAAAMWDVHFRVGGAAGSHLEASDCPKLTGSVNKNCMAAALMLHMTSQSSGYLENVWAWVADHELDGGPSQVQIDIYVARGIFIECVDGPVWLYGTSSEHSVLYQYMLYSASNIVMSMIQTESPYFLPNPQAPAPYTDAAPFIGDPTFSDCDASNTHCAAAWGLSIVGSTNVRVYGAGLYNWFQAYTQPCVDTQDCQQRVVNVEHSGQVWIYNLYTIGTVEMLNHESDKPIFAKSNTNKKAHPFTSVVNAWLLATDGIGSLNGNDDDDDDYDDGTLPVCNQIVNSLKDLEKIYDSIPYGCMGKYLSTAITRNITDTLRKYDDIINDDYASKFQTFRGVVKTQATDQIKKYMLDDRADGWRCIDTESTKRRCCGECSTSYPDTRCNFLKCDEDKGDFGNPPKCGTPNGTDVACPWFVGDFPPDIIWRLEDSDKFYRQMSDKYGIPKDWIAFGDWDVYYSYGCVWNMKHESHDALTKCMKDQDTFWRGFPYLKEDFNLEDPSQIIKGARDKTKELLNAAADEMEMADLFLSSWNDIASTVILPALTFSSAVASMESIVTVANAKIKADRDAETAGWISAIFLFIPFVGEIAGAVGLGVLRIIIDLAGSLAGTVYGIYEAVHNKDSSFETIMGIIFGAAGVGGTFKGAADAWRGMRKDNIEKMPQTFHNDINKIKKMQGYCKL